MSDTSRELVLKTLKFQNPERAPRQLWLLPWAGLHHPQALQQIQREFPDDLVGANGHLRQIPKTSGEPYALGSFVDEWGCEFTTIQAGVIGEVQNPLIKDWSVDTAKVHIPREWLSVDVEQVNRDCAARQEFIMGGCCPRPFEQLQFLRGTQNFYLDLMFRPAEMMDFLAQMHAFYCELLELWASKTQVDGLAFMDDWGTQKSLLISPDLWREIFKPLYRDYIQIAHAHGKPIFMHSDGYILDILPDLIELGLDAVNSQIFCMGLDKLAPYAGQITFWGEIDRQHLLPEATTDEIDAAVRQVRETLWRDGGCIAQCEFGPGARPENVRQVFTSWDRQ